MASSIPTLRSGAIKRALLRWAAERAEFTASEALEVIEPLYGAEECIRSGRREVASRSRVQRKRYTRDLDDVDYERIGRRRLATHILMSAARQGPLTRVSRGVYRLS